MVFKKFNGRPFVGASLQMDAIVGETASSGGTYGTADEALPDFETIPDYRTRLNTGVYVAAGIRDTLDQFFVRLRVPIHPLEPRQLRRRDLVLRTKVTAKSSGLVKIR